MNSFHAEKIDMLIKTNAVYLLINYRKDLEGLSLEMFYEF